MNELMEQIKKKDARAFTHGGKFHADDVFSAALLFYINPEITILRGNRVLDDFDGIVLILEEVRMTIIRGTAESGKRCAIRCVWIVVGGSRCRDPWGRAGRGV
mgnify:CR=1 FL=1